MPASCASLIVIIGHADKTANGGRIEAPAGETRANAYVGYFKNFTLDSKPIHFDYLFAAKHSHESKPRKLTIKALTKAPGLHISTDFKEEDYASLSLLPLLPKRTQVRLKSLIYLVWLDARSTPNPRTSFGATLPSAA